MKDESDHTVAHVSCYRDSLLGRLEIDHGLNQAKISLPHIFSDFVRDFAQKLTKLDILSRSSAFCVEILQTCL